MKHALPLLLAAWLLVGNAWAQALKGIVTVVDVQGEAQVSIDEGKSWTPIKEGQRISPGSRIKTAANGRMALLLEDRTQVRLNAHTVLDVEEVADGSRTGGQTRFRQLLGRSWVQSKTVPNGLSMRTPTAIAGIRGTDWEMAVDEDGSSRLTVLSGSVDFGNALGHLQVNASEQALAAPGQPPVKMLLVNPRQRVQWVTAYLPDPLRHLDRNNLPAALLAAFQSRDFRQAREILSASASLDGVQRSLLDATLKILELDADGGRRILTTLIHGEGNVPPDAWLLLADLDAYGGEVEAGLKVLADGLGRQPGEPRLLAMQARLLWLADRPEAATAIARQAVEAHPESPDAWLARADIARREGDVATTYTAYGKGLILNPGDDRAWYGRAVADAEREYVEAARAGLDRALDLNPGGPGYRGERGSLETFANEFSAAEADFQAALSASPADYISRTGLGLLRLKQGRPAQALEEFLKAGVMEPRYARAHVFAAVAYYQLAYRRQAEEELVRARELDPRDPLPALLQAVIRADRQEPAAAIEAAREALALMPYLKSLNQVANDQRGSANLGQAFALFGMEEWARSYAQESYDPFWAGSHLFLADRYAGLYTKNSELFQGLLADPTAFGASNRFQSLVAAPVDNGALSLRYTRTAEMEGFSPQGELSGYHVSPVPYAYYLGYENVGLDFDSGPYELGVGTAALGIKPRHDLGLFLFLDRARQDDDSLVGNLAGIPIDLDDTLITRRADLGLHYAPTPESHLWLKAGGFSSDEDTLGLLGGIPIRAGVAVRQPEYGLRHSFKPASAHLLSVGLDYALRDTDSRLDADLFPGLWVQRTDDAFRETSLDVYVSDTFTPDPRLTLQADLVWQRHRRRVDETVTDLILGFPVPNSTLSESRDATQVSPRLGLVYRFAPTRLVRVAFQNWLRPANFGSLGPVATAGIPLDDRMVSRGGELTRLRGQVEWELTPRLFASGFADFRYINNRPLSVSPFTVSELDNLGKLRPRDLSSLMRDDLLESVDAPAFSKGRLNLAGGAFNYLLDRDWSLVGRYTLAQSTNTGTTAPGLDLPYVPRHTLAGGVTWMQRGWTFTGLLVHRGERFADEANTQRLKPGLDGAFDLFWQSPDKHWLLRFSADNLIDKNEFAQYTLEANYRF